MKKSKISKGSIRAILLFTMIFLLGIGIIMEVYTVNSTNNYFFEEHDQHLTDFLSSVDHCISLVYDRCYSGVSALPERDIIQTAEKTYLETGETEELRKVVTQSELCLAAYVEQMLVFYRGEQISLGEDQQTSYYQPVSHEKESFTVVYDRTEGITYLVIRSEEDKNGFSYAVLISLPEFYRTVVPEAVYGEFWVLLFDRDSGLFLKNDGLQPEYEYYSSFDLQNGSDGYHVMYVYETEEKKGIERYTYYDNETDEQDVRMAVCASSLTENTIFEIGIALYEDNLEKSARSLNMLGILASVFIAVSIAGIIFDMLLNSRRERELKAELSALERKKKLSDALLSEQENIAHHQQLETIGTLTAGVAHEFNNLLTPIMGNSLLILENTSPENTEVYENALEIYNSSNRAKNLVNRISRLSRKSSQTQMHEMNAKQIFDRVMMVGGPSIPKNIRVIREIHTDLPFLAEENSMENLFLNLMINAVQAIGDQTGIITMEAHDDGRDVFLSVSDTGSGIPPEKLDSIFEPFFTTKAAGKGTGLGLAIARQTAENHGASLTARNIRESGACFTLRIHAYLH